MLRESLEFRAAYVVVFCFCFLCVFHIVFLLFLNLIGGSLGKALWLVMFFKTW